jgi:hypothetical protein
VPRFFNRYPPPQVNSCGVFIFWGVQHDRHSIV